LAGIGRDLIERYYPGIRLEGLRRTTKTLNQDSRCSGLDLNPEPLENESGVLTRIIRRCVVFVWEGEKLAF